MDAFEKLERALAKTTQEKLSLECEIPQSQISLVSRKLRVPSIEHIPALNKAIGTTLEEWVEAAEELKAERAKKRAKRVRKAGRAA